MAVFPAQTIRIHSMSCKDSAPAFLKADSHTAIYCMPTGIPCLATPIRRRLPPDQVSARRLSDPSFASRLYQLELSVLNICAYCKLFLFIYTNFFLSICLPVINCLLGKAAIREAAIWKGESPCFKGRMSKLIRRLSKSACFV